LDGNTPAIFELFIVLLCRSLAQLDSWNQIAVIYRALCSTAKEEAGTIPLDAAGRAELKLSFSNLAGWLQLLKSCRLTRAHWPADSQRKNWAEGIAYAAAAQATELLGVYARLFAATTDAQGYWRARQPVVAEAQTAAAAWAEVAHGIFRSELEFRRGYHRLTDKYSIQNEMVQLADELGMDVEAARKAWEGFLGIEEARRTSYLQERADGFADRAQAERFVGDVYDALAEYFSPNSP
jgi:hypothetical protein